MYWVNRVDLHWQGRGIALVQSKTDGLARMSVTQQQYKVVKVRTITTCWWHKIIACLCMCLPWWNISPIVVFSPQNNPIILSHVAERAQGTKRFLRNRWIIPLLGSFLSKLLIPCRADWAQRPKQQGKLLFFFSFLSSRKPKVHFVNSRRAIAA